MGQRAFVRIVVFAAVAGATALSAQVTTTFRAERERLEKAAYDMPAHKKLTEGEILHNRMVNPFKASDLKVQKVLPGSSVSVTVSGDFPAGTAVLSERDGVTLSGAALTTTSYSARLTIAPDEGPGFVRLWAITQVEKAGATAVAFVDTFYRFNLKSPEGYTVKIAPIDKTFTMLDSRHAEGRYRAEFFKPGEEKPFETLTGSQAFESGDAPFASHTPYARLDIDFDPESDAPPQDMQKALEEMAKALQADPASLNKKMDDFGCGLLQMYPNKGGTVEGNIGCGQNFNNGTGMLRVTGTMTQVR